MNTDTEISFSDYYVAYFDILGYRSYFSKQSERSLDFVKSIEAAIAKTKLMIENNKKSTILSDFGQLKIEYRIFSDNILLCMKAINSPFEKIRLLTFLQIVCDIQRGFIADYGLFMRGGICKGSFLITENSIHGQALIECVLMEENAEYPRILVSDSILNVIIQKRIDDYEQDKYIDELLQKQDTEGKITEFEKMQIDKYIQSLKMEISIKEWYLRLVVRKNENDKAFLNYLYNLDVDEVFPQFTNHIRELPNLMTKLKSLSEYDISSLNNALKFNQHEALKIMMETHKKRCLEKIREYCNYCDIDKTNLKEIEARKKIIKKYVWLVDLHNLLCIKYDLKDNIIQVFINLNTVVLDYELFTEDKTITEKKN